MTPGGIKESTKDMDKNGFVVYFDEFDPLMELDDATLGRIFRGLYNYARSGVLPDLTGADKALFETIRIRLDRRKGNGSL